MLVASCRQRYNIIEAALPVPFKIALEVGIEQVASERRYSTYLPTSKAIILANSEGLHALERRYPA